MSQIRAGVREAANVGPSYLSKWLCEERVPSLSSGYVEKIADYLGLDGSTRARLKAAQVHSLTEWKPLPTRKRRPKSHDAVEGIVNPSSPAIPTSAPKSPVQRPPISISRSGLVRGRAHILRAAIRLVLRAPQCAPGDEKIILMSMQSSEPWSMAPGEEGLQAAWAAAMAQALARGWVIRQLWRLEHVERSLHLVEAMIKLARFPGYQPQYFRTYGMVRPPYDALVVPGVGALTFLSSTSEEYLDAAFLAEDPQHVQVIESHCLQQFAQTEQLLHGFIERQQEILFTRELVQREDQPGGRRCVRRHLSALTFPPTWFQEGSPFARMVAETGFVAENDRAEYLELLAWRWRNFEARIGTGGNQYLDVCVREKVDWMFREGLYAEDTAFFSAPIAKRDRIEHLRHLLRMLRHDQYQLTLVDNEVDFSSSMGWGTVGNAVILTLTTLAAKATDIPQIVNLYLTEPKIVLAFRRYFDSLWRSHIRSPDEEKRATVNWLQAHLDRLEREVREEEQGR